MSQRTNIPIQGGCASEFGPVSSGAPAIGFVDNATVANGRPVPLRMPELWPDAVPDHMRYLARIDGEWRFSTGKRDYCRHTGIYGDQLLWTEAGQVPMKEVNKKQITLGVANPKMRPVVTANGPIGVQKVVGTASGTGGTHPEARTRYVRIAYETATGVLPACPAGTCSPTLGQIITWTWANQEIGMDVTRILVFAGYARDEEAHVASLEPGIEEWIDLGSASDSGVLALDYDSSFSYQYVYTLVREVDGIVDESGPSPLSQSVSGQVVRRIVLNQDTDGLMDALPDQVRWSEADGAWSITSGLDGPRTTSDAVLALNADGAEWRATLNEPAIFYVGQRLILVGTQDSGAVVKNYPATVRKVDGVEVTLEVTGLLADDVAIFDAGGITLQDTFAAVVTSTVDAGPEGVKINLSAPVAWGVGDQILLRKTGFDDEGEAVVDAGWDAKPYRIESVAPDLLSVNVVSYEIFTPGTTILTAYAMKSRFVHRSGKTVPGTGTMFEVTLNNRLYRCRVLSGATLSTGESVWLLEGLIPTTLSSMDSVRWAESSAFFTKRILWRTGGTGAFQLVAELPMATTEYLDVLPDSKLGDVIRTYYQNSLGFVVFAPPPPDLKCLRSHAGTHWGIAGFKVRAAEPGFPDAWPDIYEWTFPARPQRIESYNGALIVFCSDAIYRIDGDAPERAIQSITRATDGCLAADSVAVAGGTLLYVGYRGLMAFNGNTSEPVAEGRIPQTFWRMPSVYTQDDAPGSLGNMLAIPSRHTAGYHRISEFPAIHESGLAEARETRGPIQGLAAFYSAGKYVAFWRAGSEENQANGCVIVDLSDRGIPVTMSGLRIRDAWVDEYETPWLLLPAPQDSRPNNYVMVYTADYTSGYFPETAGLEPFDIYNALPTEVTIMETNGNAAFTIAQIVGRDGTPLVADLDINRTYTVTCEPTPTGGEFIVDSGSYFHTTDSIWYRTKTVVLRPVAGSPLPVGTYTIKSVCNEEPEKVVEVKVHVVPAWTIQHAWHSVEPDEPGSSFGKITMRVWPSVDLGEPLTVIDYASVPTMGFSVVSEGGANPGEAKVAASVLLTAQEVRPRFHLTNKSAFYETSFNGVKRQVPFYYQRLLAELNPRLVESRPSSTIAGILPGASVLKASWGGVYAAGGSDLYPSESKTPSYTPTGYTLAEGLVTTYDSDDPDTIKGWWVDTSVPDEDRVRVSGWKLNAGGSTTFGKLNFSDRRLDVLADMGEHKLRPIIHEQDGEVVVLGGSAFLQPRMADGRVKNCHAAITTATGRSTAASPLSPPSCGWDGHGSTGNWHCILEDGGQDSCRNVWYAGTNPADPAAMLFVEDGREMATQVPAAYSADGPGAINVTKYGGSGASFYGTAFFGLDARLLR